MPGGPPRAMLGSGTFPMGVEVEGCRLFTLFTLSTLSTLFPVWLSSSMNSSRGPGCTLAGVARASWLAGDFPWENKDKDQNETRISRKNYRLAAPGSRESGARGPRERTDRVTLNKQQLETISTGQSNIK